MKLQCFKTERLFKKKKERITIISQNILVIRNGSTIRTNGGSVVEFKKCKILAKFKWFDIV